VRESGSHATLACPPGQLKSGQRLP
jgi:hypothetical protein